MTLYENTAPGGEGGGGELKRASGDGGAPNRLDRAWFGRGRVVAASYARAAPPMCVFPCAARANPGPRAGTS